MNNFAWDSNIHNLVLSNFPILVSCYSPAYNFHQVQFPYYPPNKPLNSVSLPNLWKISNVLSFLNLIILPNPTFSWGLPDFCSNAVQRCILLKSWSQWLEFWLQICPKSMTSGHVWFIFGSLVVFQKRSFWYWYHLLWYLITMYHYWNVLCIYGFSI